MNQKERFLTALSGGTPDRVPTFVHAMNEASIVQIARHFTDKLPAIKPVHTMNLEEKLSLCEALMLIHEELEIDAITGVPISQNEAISDTLLKDEWGVVFKLSPYGEPVPIEHPISCKADLKSYKRPEPNSGGATFAARLMRERFGSSKALVHRFRSIIPAAWFLCGIENFLMGFVADPEFVTQLLRMVTDYNLELFDLFTEVGVDALIFGDDIADKNNTFISPKQYQKLVKPFHAELVEKAHSLGMKAIFHSDGKVDSLIDDLVDVGFDGLNPIEPQCMDIAWVKKQHGKDICLVGNIDCGELLCHGSEQEVIAEVQRTIDIAAPGGGYILCDSNSVHPGVKPKNFIAMIQATQKHGVYSA